MDADTLKARSEKAGGRYDVVSFVQASQYIKEQVVVASRVYQTQKPKIKE